MKIPAYVVCQAVKKEFNGIKGYGHTGYFFMTKQDAEAFLMGVLDTIHREMKIGVRKENTLNPDEWLDFSINECMIDIPEEKIIGRGWNLPEKFELKEL